MSIRSAVLTALILTATFASGLCDSIAFAQNERKAAIGADFHPTSAQVEDLKKLFTRTTESKTFFHWTKPETGMRWMVQGHINQGEVDFYNQPTEDLQAYGAGIYMASTPTSSEGFGEFCVVFKMRAGTLVYTPEAVKNVLGRDLNNDEITELGKKIPFIRDLNGDWFLTHTAQNLGNIEYAGPYGGDAHMFRGTDQRTMLKAIEAAKPFGDIGYIESFFHLMHYMDGISLQRAIRVAPSNPWSQFEPQLFENFRKLNQSALETSVVSPEVATWAPNEPDKEKWANQQVKVKIPGLINSLNNSKGAAFRGHQIRAGGTNSGNTFLASPQELNVLLSNPYLTVHSQPDGSGFGFLVSYDYPSIQSLAKLKPLLSADTYEQLEKHSAQSISNDRSLEVRLNQILIEDLLRNLMRDIHGKAIDPADFINRYISIHPFSDGNGRTGRLFLQEHMNLVGRSLAPFYMSDLDLLVSKETLTKVIEDSDKAYLNLQKAMLGELISSNFGKKRMPDYFKLKQFSELISSISAFGFKSDDRIDARFDEQIAQRRFHEMFVEMKGPTWSLTADSSLPGALDLARKSKATNYLRNVGQKTAQLIKGLKNSDDLVDTNNYLKNFMLYGTGLKEYPSLKKAYAFKIKQIVRKLDYNKLGYFDILDQYLEVAPPQEARETLAFIARGLKMRPMDPAIAWEVQDKQRELRSRVQTSEMKYLIGALTEGSMTAAEFSGRIGRLELQALELTEFDLDLGKLKTLNQKLTWKQQTAFLQRLNFTNFEVNDELSAFMTTLVEPLRGLPETEAVEYRKYLGTQLSSFLQANESKKPVARLFFELWLQTVPNTRYSLVDVMSGQNQLVLDRMIEIVEEDTLGHKVLSKDQTAAVSYYIYYANSANKRLRIDYKTWTEFLKTNQDSHALITTSLRPFHFKTPLYYALLAHHKNDDASKLQIITAIHDNSPAVAGGEQLRLELLKEAKRVLKPESYVAFATSAAHVTHVKGYDKLAKKAGGIILKPVFAEFSKAKPDFSASLEVLSSLPKIWANFSESQIKMLLADPILLSRVVKSSWTLKLDPQQYALLSQAVENQTDSVKKSELQSALRDSFISAWSEASYYKVTPETLQWQFAAFLKFGKPTPEQAMLINSSIGQHLDVNSRAGLISVLKKDFFRSLKLLVSQKMDLGAQASFFEKDWAQPMSTQKLSVSEKALITNAIRASKNPALLTTLYSVPNTTPLVGSDYYQAMLSAVGSFSPDVQKETVRNLAQLFLGRSVLNDGGEDNSKTTQASLAAEAQHLELSKESFRQLWKTLPYNLEIEAKAALDETITTYTGYDGAYKRAAVAIGAYVNSADFKRDVYKLRYGRTYVGPRTCQAVFSPLMN